MINAQEKEAFPLTPAFPPFSFGDMRDSCHVQCHWGRAQILHILQASSSMSVTSYRFIIRADAHLSFFIFFFFWKPQCQCWCSFCPVKPRRWYRSMSSTLIRDQEGSVCPRASFPLVYITAEQCCPLGRRSSPQGLGHTQQPPVPWLCFSQRITDISLALTLIKCMYSEQNAARFCVFWLKCSLSGACSSFCMHNCFCSFTFSLPCTR